MKLPLFQVDAFATRPFEGNPAAVCPLPGWLPDATLQAIAEENNLSETAFFVAENDGFRIRWFTPTVEVDLCGHATLASAWVILNELHTDLDEVRFDSLSGPLIVRRRDSVLELDFPLQTPEECDVPEALVRSLGKPPLSCYRRDDYVLVYDDEQFVRSVDPNLEILATVDCRGVIISSAAEDFDFVARFFGPRCGVPEDPVTGSAYTQLAPVWESRLGKRDFSARQVSKRGGNIELRIEGERVRIAGSAVLYLRGEICVDDGRSHEL